MDVVADRPPAQIRTNALASIRGILLCNVCRFKGKRYANDRLGRGVSGNEQFRTDVLELDLDNHPEDLLDSGEHRALFPPKGGPD